MINILGATHELLTEDGYECSVENLSDFSYITFENSTFLGFMLEFDKVESLVEDWRTRFKELIIKNQFAFRAAKSKAWNVYLVLLTQEEASASEKISLDYIQEDLSEARKITAAGVNSYDNLIEALLPLLKIQTSPRLGAIDFRHELQLRLSDLPDSTFRLFMSDAPIEQVLKLLRDPQ